MGIHRIKTNRLVKLKLNICPYQVRGESGLEMQQCTNDRNLLQPLAAGLLPIFLVLASIVESRPQRHQKLLCQRAQRSRRRLAEDHVSPQLQGRVWWGTDGEPRERDLRSSGIARVTLSPSSQYVSSTCSNTYALFH